MKLCCVLTAAGLSRRYGSDKLAAQVDGKPMIEPILRILGELPFEKRFLVTQRSKLPLIDLGVRYGFTPVYNDAPEEGLSLSVRLGTERAVHAKADGILFAVGDQPHLRRESVEALIDCFDREPDRIVALAANGKRGNPVIFPKTTFADLLSITGDVGGSAVIRKHSDLLQLCDAARPEELMDIDRPAEGDRRN